MDAVGAMRCSLVGYETQLRQNPAKARSQTLTLSYLHAVLVATGTGGLKHTGLGGRVSPALWLVFHTALFLSHAT